MHDIIDSWVKRNKLKARDRRLLLEAYRRYNMFAVRDNKGITKAWLGLGTKAAYGKSEYFRALDTLPPRCGGWWVLTEDGVDVLVDLIRVLPWKEEYSLKIFISHI